MTQNLRQFKKAAECLADEKDAIIQEWLQAVEEKLPASMGQDCPAITDHVPDILERLAKCLSEPSLSDHPDRS